MVLSFEGAQAQDGSPVWTRKNSMADAIRIPSVDDEPYGCGESAAEDGGGHEKYFAGRYSYQQKFSVKNWSGLWTVL